MTFPGNSARQIPLFAVVGGAATVLHVVVAITVDAAAAPPPLVSNVCGFLSAVLLSYVGHTRLTFGIAPDHRFHFPRFIIAALLGLVLSSLLTWLSVDALGVPFSVAMLIVATVVPIVTFLILKFWAFAGASSR